MPSYTPQLESKALVNNLRRNFEHFIDFDLSKLLIHHLMSCVINVKSCIGVEIVIRETESENFFTF